MFSPEVLKLVKENCSYPRGKRPAEAISNLASVTASMRIFSGLIASQGASALYHLCQFLQYECWGAKSYIFKYNDIGTKFYIILEGKVSILIPDTDPTTFMEIMCLESGASFGEVALETSNPRSASAYCKGPSHFLVLEKKDYLKHFQRTISAAKQNLISFLQTLPMFNKISKVALTRLSYSITEKTCIKNQRVFREQQPVTHIYIIKEGEFGVCKTFIRDRQVSRINTNTKYDTYTARKLGPGVMMGEEDAFNNNLHSYTAICNSDSGVLYCITTKEFFLRINADETLEYLKKQAENKLNYIENWRNVRVSLNHVFSNRETEQTPERARKVKEYVKDTRIQRSSSSKVLAKVRNCSLSARMEQYTQRLEHNDKNSQIPQGVLKSKFSSRGKNLVSLVSMNCLPIFEGLWTKKIEKYYRNPPKSLEKSPPKISTLN